MTVTLQNMAKPQFKYLLEFYVGQLPREIKLADELERLGIPARTFYRDKSLKIGGQGDITGERLTKYASLFKVSVDQLFNTEASKLKTKLK